MRVPNYRTYNYGTAENTYDKPKNKEYDDASAEECVEIEIITE